MECYEDTARWTAMMRRGMARDFSWERSVATYIDVYRRALARSASIR
jgi:glycogen synthase